MELKLDPAEISSVLRRHIEESAVTVGMEEVGEVIEAGDGICRIKGLPSCMSAEMLELPGGIFAMALNLEMDQIGAVILGDPDKVEQGMQVKRTGRILEVPVGPELLGRVVNGVGQPVDGKGPLNAKKFGPIEGRSPNVVQRQPVKEPVQTGLKCIDSMIPIGRGQRELIIGDRQTGKTALAIDAIINQRDTDVYCIYVAMGQKQSTVVGVVETLEKYGAMDYTIVVAANASDPASMQYIAPYAGCAMGEAFRDNGKHALIIYDDLSKHAVAYRTMSLLLRRPPGREAFPGDIFNLHSRLLERAAKLSDRSSNSGNAGGRLLGIHPNQCHLDHRRADFSRNRPVLRRREAGCLGRAVGFPRGRERPDSGHEEGRGNATAFARTVPRTGRVRPVRIRA